MVLALGRLSYSAHFILYPVIGIPAAYLYDNKQKASAEAAIAFTQEMMPKAKDVDPDNFNPFSAIPFHNNMENRYRFANM